MLADASRRVLAAGIELDRATDDGASEALYLRDTKELPRMKNRKCRFAQCFA